MMRVLITGATGFIGQHVLGQLVSKQVEVVATVRNTQSAEQINKHYPIVKTVHADISTLQDDSLYIKCEKPDALIHLAWGGLPNYNSLHHIEKELPSHYQFISHMVRSGVRTVMVAGTCFEYGMQQGCLDESLPSQPSNSYGFAKDSLRKQLSYLQQDVAFNLIWPRFFYMYGQGQSKTSLYTLLMQAIKNQDKVFNMSGGEQLRDFIPVGEIAEHLIYLLSLEKNLGIVNVCSGRPISVRRFVENIAEKNHAKIDFNLGYYPYPTYEPMAFWGHNKKLLKLLSNTS
jgi:nucleoside-diphosphate-sugar epimerase